MKLYRITFLTTLVIIFLGAGKLFAQTDSKQASAVIEGEVKTKLVLTPADIDKLPKTPVSAKDHAEKEHTYTGVELWVLLKDAGATLGDQLRGPNLKKYLLVKASDGYQVVFSLAEVDPAFSARKVILANRKDGVLLSGDEGPFQIVVEGEKRKARNARQVVSIAVKFP